MEVKLEPVFEDNDLGILIETEHAFHVPVAEKLKKDNSMLVLIRLSFFLLTYCHSATTLHGMCLSHSQI